MSSQPSRAIYLRDQADKCRWHAGLVSNAEIQAELLKLAADYIERAAVLESAE